MYQDPGLIPRDSSWVEEEGRASIRWEGISRAVVAW